MDEKKAKPSAAAITTFEEPVPGALDGNEPHPDYPGLTRADVKAAQDRARKRAEDARKKAALKDIEDAEFKRVEEEEGITAGGPGNDMVEVTLDMPPVAYGKNDTDAWIQLDGKRYRRGQTLLLRRRVAHDLLFIAQQMRLNESARLGEDKFAFYQRQQAPLISKKGTVVPGGGRDPDILKALRA